MLECHLTQALWVDWKLYILQDYGADISIDIADIICNTFVPRPASVINLLGLILKQLIYHYKCEQKLLKFSRYKLEIIEVENIEKYNAQVANKVALHQLKWEKIIKQ